MKLWTDDGRTTEPAYTISSPGAFGLGRLKRSIMESKFHNEACFPASLYRITKGKFTIKVKKRSVKRQKKIFYEENWTFSYIFGGRGGEQILLYSHFPIGTSI